MPSTNKNLPEGALTWDELQSMRSGDKLYAVFPSTKSGKLARLDMVTFDKICLCKDNNQIIVVTIPKDETYSSHTFTQEMWTENLGYTFTNYWHARATLLRLKNEHKEPA